MKSSTLVVRTGVLTLVALAAGAALAQSNVIPMDKKTRSSAAVKMDTRAFVPQISEKVRSFRKSSEKNEYIHNLRTGSANNLRFGTNNGSTGNNRGPLFNGIEFGGSVPPDPTVAASKTHVVETVNTAIAFYTKTGTKQFQAEFDNGSSGFFSGLGANAFQFDPKVFFDKASNRFFVLCLDQNDVNQTSNLLIAVSDDGDPNGQWFKYKVDNVEERDNKKYWLDYPGFGYNKDAVVVTGNMFEFGTNGYGFVKSLLFKKSELMSGATLNVSSALDVTGSFTVQVANMHDTTTPYVYGVALESFSSVKVYAWKDVLTAPTIVTANVTVPSFSNPPRLAPGLGGTVLDAIPGRVFDANFRLGSLLTAHVAATSDGRGQVAWYDIKPGTWPASGNPTLFQSGRVAGAGDTWVFMPSINMNAAKDITMIMTRSSRNIAADVMICSRKASDPAGTMGPLTQVATSTTPTLNAGRWGDYFKVTVDPSDDLTFWGVGMVNRPSDGLWRTIIHSWKVSTGGGGGNTGIKPDAVSVLEGSFSAGSLANIQNPDGSTYDSNSVKKGDGSYATAVQTTFTSSLGKMLIGDIQINVRGYSQPSKPPTGSIFLWNWGANKWDIVKSYSVPGSLTNFSATMLAGGSTYVSDAKKVRVMFRALDPNRRNGVAPAPFKLRLDSVQVVLVPK